MEMHEPYTFLNGLTVADMEDLLEDIQVRPCCAPGTAAATPAPGVPSPTVCTSASRCTWSSSRARTRTSGGT